MRTVDIIFELIDREFEAALYLKLKLESIGYKARILNKNLDLNLFKSSEITIIPNCYNTSNYDFYNYAFNLKNMSAINLQSEQIISRKDEENGFYNPKGLAESLTHICWGDNSYKRLFDNGISESNLKVLGSLNLDFSQNEFSNFWYSKEYLSKIYQIDKNRKWVLFISSFSLNNEDGVIDNLVNQFGLFGDSNYLRDFSRISLDSQKTILDWIEKYLTNNDKYIFIYRPHPAEKENLRIKALEEKFSNSFFCINGMRINQWLSVCDIITNWFSTSIVDAIYMNKHTIILRPYKIPKDFDIPFLNSRNNIFVEDYHNFCSSLEVKFNCNNNSVLAENISKYYLNQNRQVINNYINMIDSFEKVPVKEMDNYFINRIKYLLFNKLIIKSIIKKLYYIFYYVTELKIDLFSIREKYNLENIEKIALYYKYEYLDKRNRLKDILNEKE